MLPMSRRLVLLSGSSPNCPIFFTNRVCFISPILPPGLLAKKTRILVTNRLEFCSGSDLILWMQNGKIAVQGSYEELMKTNEAFRTLMRDQGGDGGGDETKDLSKADLESARAEVRAKAKFAINKETDENQASLIAAETSRQGSLSLQVGFWLSLSCYLPFSARLC